MDLFCPLIKFNRNILVCIYNCKSACKCEVYEKNYVVIKEQEIEEKYITKYGAPEYPLPDGIARKEKQRLKREKAQAKLALDKERKAKKKAKLDAKENKLAAKAEKNFKKLQKQREKEERFKKLQEKYAAKSAPVEVKPEPTEPKKRKRRTKQEMLAAQQDVEVDFTFMTMPEPKSTNVITMKVLKKRTTVPQSITLDKFFDL